MSWKYKFIFKIQLVQITLSFFIYTSNVLAGAQHSIDVYKSNQISIDIIKGKFSREFQTISDVMLSVGSLHSEKNTQLLSDSISKITSGIYEMGSFSYIGVSPIVYPGDKVVHITVDLIDVKDTTRRPCFLSEPKENIKNIDHLISHWMDYEKIGFELLLNENQNILYKSCPANHCVFGFDHALLKKYKYIFNTLVPTYKHMLVETLRKDRDENKRAACAYLLAHIKNRNELVSILVPSIFDSSELVRNNVMRVLGVVLINNPSIKFPIDSVFKALDFPATTDRNKALLIISALSTNPTYIKFITKKVGDKLIDHLRLSQPNLHNLAYETLKKISGKKYGEYDYQSWDNWLRQVR